MLLEDDCALVGVLIKQNTLSECVIFIAFPPQIWLQECDSLLHYMVTLHCYIAWLCYIVILDCYVALLCYIALLHYIVKLHYYVTCKLPVLCVFFRKV